ncbi:MAG: 4-hydroxy-tetrahydrodipicolinate synthase [Desulfovibrionaceae bacterium]|nr:4-hydroxy-tetrahydrodipicolinate synthase [Desulfovibrionaceae bacterium]
MFRGAITALVTPFRNGALDEEAYRALIEWQIEQGIDGLVPCGTTGESATMSHDEHEEAVRICIEQVRGRVPVMAGAGSNNTAEAIRLTAFAKQAGADAALLISPYYNKPTQEGVFRHFKAVNDAVDLPLFVYNVPGRTGSNVLPSTVARMARELPHVVGIKEATGNLVQVSEVVELCGDGFTLLSGDDLTALPSFSVGGKGVISVTSNVLPARVAAMCAAWNRGDTAEALRLHGGLMPMNRALFLESNPIPVKTALHLMGRMSAEFRLPLCPLGEENLVRLREVMAASGLL